MNVVRYETVVPSGTSEWWVPENAMPVTVAVDPQGGEAYVETTLSSREDIADGTALWIGWPNGPISAPLQDTTVGFVTGMRFVSVSGDARFIAAYKRD